MAIVTTSNEVTNDRIRSYGTSLQADWEVGGGHSLTSITAWDVYYGKAHPLAADSLPLDLGIVEETGEATAYSQEIRIASPTGRRIEYLGGLYAYRNDTFLRASIPVGPEANRLFPLPPAAGGPQPFRPGDATFTHFDQTTHNVAAFGTLTYHVTDSWRISAGARYSRDRKRAFISHTTTLKPSRPFLAVFGPNPIGRVKGKEDGVTWSATTQYDLSEDVMGFARVATGSKSGGFSARRQPAGAPVEFEDERSVDCELGFRERGRDRGSGRLQRLLRRAENLRRRTRAALLGGAWDSRWSRL